MPFNLTIEFGFALVLEIQAGLAGPWDTWVKTYKAEPPVWFHDIFRADGSVYDGKEVEYIKKVTGKAKF